MFYNALPCVVRVAAGEGAFEALHNMIEREVVIVSERSFARLEEKPFAFVLSAQL